MKGYARSSAAATGKFDAFPASLLLYLSGAPFSAKLPSQGVKMPIQAADSFVRLTLISSRPIRLGGFDDDEGHVANRVIILFPLVGKEADRVELV